MLIVRNFCVILALPPTGQMLFMENLNHWQQLAYCATLAERSFPNYALFASLSKDADAPFMRRALNKVWEYLRGQLKSLKNIENQLLEMEHKIPDPEQFEGFGVYPALDTSLAIQSCLMAIIDHSITDAEDISALMWARLNEVIDLQGEDGGLTDRHIGFEADIKTILASQISHADAVKKLQQLAKEDGYSHIGVGLDE